MRDAENLVPADPTDLANAFALGCDCRALDGGPIS